MGNAVVHFEVMAQDRKKASAFYSDLFGWKIDANNPVGYGVIAREDNLTAEGIGIGGGMMALPPEMAQSEATEGSNGHVTWYVEVPDVEATMAKAVKLGGQRLHGPDTVPGGGPTLGQITDPEGHLIGVVQSGSM